MSVEAPERIWLDVKAMTASSVAGRAPFFGVGYVRIDKLEEQEKALKAAKELVDWCYGEVGADIDLTPGLRALCEYFGGYDVG